MPPETNHASRLESGAFYVLLATIALAPIVFWPSQYFALEAVKTALITLGVFTSVVLFVAATFHERELRLPPRSMVWLGVLGALSAFLSSVVSGHFEKSFFGQGFELGTGIFVIVLLMAALAAFFFVSRKAERVIALYAGLAAPFILLFVFHALRLVVGPGHLTLGFLSSAVSTVIGNWYALAIYAMVLALIALLALIILPLSSRLKSVYWVILILAVATLCLVNSSPVWKAASLVFLGLAVYMSFSRPRHDGAGGAVSILRRVAWAPTIAFLIAALLVFQSTTFFGPAINKLNIGYSELTLPWQMTLDIASGELKSAPVFGAGPNRFTAAFLENKPLAINTTDAWGVEFNYGFGLIPTVAVTQGLLGALLWALFLVFFGILGLKSLRGLGGHGHDGVPALAGPEDAYARFAIISSYFSAMFLWLISVIYIPPHAVLLAAFILTGVWLGSSVAYGRLHPLTIASRSGGRSRLALALSIMVAVIAIFLGLICLKDTAALAYFGTGVKQLTGAGDVIAADRDFSSAVSLNPLDVYWQARSEAAIVAAKQLVGTVTPSTSASTSQAIATAAAKDVNMGFLYATNAINADPDNYYNYLSKARVSEIATNLRMTNGYETAVAAYKSAIQKNPLNPSIYLSLAKLQASQNKLDDALQTIGAALQVKSNYVDAVFLLSQIEATKGNLPDAITAAQFAASLNPQNPLLFLQLGLLQYAKADYSSAMKSLEQAVALQPDYANAEYFLGLTYARLNQMDKATAVFQALAKTNPDSQEVSVILSALRAGKPLFTGPVAAAATPEKRATPPLPEKTKK